MARHKANKFNVKNIVSAITGKKDKIIVRPALEEVVQPVSEKAVNEIVKEDIDKVEEITEPEIKEVHVCDFEGCRHPSVTPLIAIRKNEYKCPKCGRGYSFMPSNYGGKSRKRE